LLLLFCAAHIESGGAAAGVISAGVVSDGELQWWHSGTCRFASEKKLKKQSTYYSIFGCLLLLFFSIVTLINCVRLHCITTNIFAGGLVVGGMR